MAFGKKPNHTAGRIVARFAENTVLALMVAVVIGLTAAIIALLALNAAFEEEVPFRMEQLTSSESGEGGEIGGHFLPAFIGISVKGEQRGISAGHNVVNDVYALFAPVLSDVLSGEAAETDAGRFDACAAEQSFVYFRYHTPMPHQAIHACAGGTEETYDSSVSVYEMFILPDKGFRIFVKDADGSAWFFDGTYEAYFTVETLYDLLQSYQRNFADFVFTDDGTGEPQFTERVRTKNMLVTEKTASLIQERDEHIASFLRLMDFNPDKLYTHEESDVGYVYVENHGVFRLLEDSVEYTASAEGGISVEKYLGYYGNASYSLGDYIGTACLIADRMKSMSVHYAGGDAEILLSSAFTDEKGVLTLQFVYTFDNLLLAECEPALEVSFRGGRMIAFRLYTVSARNLGTQEVSLHEEWYRDEAAAHLSEGEYIRDIRQVYRTDFRAESVGAEWSALVGRKETAAVRPPRGDR